MVDDHSVLVSASSIRALLFPNPKISNNSLMPPVKGRLDGLPMALKKRSNLWVMSLCMMPTITANHSKNPVSCQLITDQC